MRIALYHNLPSGGAKRTLQEATKRLTKKHHIDVYSLTTANHDFADIRPYAVNHHQYTFKPLPLFSSPFGRLNQAIRLLDLLRLQSFSKTIAIQIEQNNYDVVLAHPCQFSKSPTILSHLHHVPSIYYCQEPLRLLYETMPLRPYDDENFPRRQLLNKIDPLPGLYHKVLKRIDRQNTRQADKVLVNSKFMETSVNRIYQVKAQVSYHGVDTDWFQPCAEEKQQMVLSVGSLTPLKGFDFLIRAMAHLPASQRPELVIASNFQNLPEKEYLEHLAAQHHMRLKLLNNISDTDLVRLYNQAKVVAYAPVREPFGLVPLEAMACGTPVVAIREGGIQETVIDGQTGILVDRHPEQFGRAIQTLIQDEALATTYGSNGRAYVLQNWTWDKAAGTLENHLTSYRNGKQ